MKVFFRRLLSVLIVCLVAFFTIGINAFAGTSKITVVWGNPGENCSYELSFSWQSTEPTSVFKFALKEEADFSNAKTYNCTGFKSEHFTTYGYKLEIDGLTPATTYKYQITSGDATTEVYEIKTASVASDFNFAWISDMHVHTGSANRITFTNNLLQKINKDSGGIDMILVTGDEVAYGGSQGAYEMLADLSKNPLLQTTMWSCVPGNHTYYPDGGNKLITNQFFENMTNHPKNGYDEKSSSYWFLYNSIMFVALDSLTIQNSSTTISSQQDWFKQVVEENQGKFQYLIVFQHFPWLNALTGALSAGYYSGYKAWCEIFDQYGVDLALAGDYHTYYRSNRIYNGEVVDLNSDKGTIYMGNRQIGGRAAGGSYYIKDRQNPTYYACRLDNEYAESSGAGYFHVTSEGLTWTMYDHKTLEVVDSVTIPAKRGINWNGAKDDVLESTFFTSTGTNGYVNFDTNYKDYISTVTVKNATGETLATINPIEEKNNTVSLSGLEANTSFKLTVAYKFADDTTKEITIDANTYGNYGEVYGFNILSSEGKLKAEFNYDLVSDKINKFEIYQDDKMIETFTPTELKGKYSKLLDGASLDLDAIYKLVGKNSKDEILFTANKQYTFYGDMDVNGLFDIKDIDASFDKIATNVNIEGNALSLNDFNGDGTFDIGDVILMYQAVKDNKETIKENVYKVTFLDYYGNVVSTQNVKEMEDAVIPEFSSVSGYTFAYLSGSNKQIASDIVIKAVYQAN